jgi:hypothetical protein
MLMATKSAKVEREIEAKEKKDRNKKFSRTRVTETLLLLLLLLCIDMHSGAQLSHTSAAHSRTCLVALHKWFLHNFDAQQLFTCTSANAMTSTVAVAILSL